MHLSSYFKTISYSSSIKMRLRIYLFPVILLFLLSLSGCINRKGAQVTAGIDLKQFHKFYVVKFGPDNRGINRLIMDELLKRGFEASTGLVNIRPKDVGAIVTYQDKWKWDMTMYMIELKIFFREPETQKLLASGESYHSSFSRNSPEEMVSEVLSNIFSK